MGSARAEPVKPALRAAPHVVQISFFSDPQRRAPRELLRSWSTLVDVAEAAALGGARVSVVQACAHHETVECNEVRYLFRNLDAAVSAADRPLAALLRELAPDVLHVHGLDCPRELLSLAALAQPVPVILQDHASRPPRPRRRPLYRRAFAAAAGVAFCAAAQARPFARAGVLPAASRVFEIPESTTRFSPGDRDAAREATGVEGEPAVLWVGHLNANKDPLTVLAALSAAVQVLPRLRLYCCFGAAPLLSEVQRSIARDSRLRERVTLLGRVPHERVEQLMRAADLFVLGSHHEGSGYALIEALACGLPPVVSDIPSFRALTGQGAIGALWRCGDARALEGALRAMAMRCSESMRTAVRAHFERELSFAALGARLAAMYADVIGHAQRAAGSECPAPENV
jgi:glycosyltransferase involved in cell wall biosynthesis